MKHIFLTRLIYLNNATVFKICSQILFNVFFSQFFFLHFFLCGYAEDLVIRSKPTLVEDNEKEVQEAIASIGRNMIGRVIEELGRYVGRRMEDGGIF